MKRNRERSQRFDLRRLLAFPLLRAAGEQPSPSPTEGELLFDTKGIPLALASEAIELGCMVDLATGEPFPWEAAEQVLPVRGPLRRYLLSSGYRRLRDRASSAFRTDIDWDGYREKIASNPPPGNTP